MKKPQYINKPFKNLPLKQRAVFILHLAKFSTREILSLGIISGLDTVSRYITKSYDEYRKEIISNRDKGEEI